MDKIRVLFSARPGAFKSPGCGEVLMLQSKRYLEKEGVHVELFTEGKTDFRDFDLLHNFSVHRDCFSAIKDAKAAGLHVAVSPVYWPSLRFALHNCKPLGQKLKMLGAELLNRLPFSTVRKMLDAADAVLPSSVAEAEMLHARFAVPAEKTSLVFNGVDESFKESDAKMFKDGYKTSDFVLYVGRIEERKNVLSLIKAMNGTGKRLVVIGNPLQGSGAYFEKCKKTAEKGTKFLKAIPHESEMLSSAYAACKVFALPSWYETPGLAALEAGLAGANIAVTREGPAREYFGSFASYVNPAKVDDIREKVLGEFEKPSPKGLREHIAEHFLWQNTAQQSRAAYEKILGGRSA